jgi:enoyl-CoA hydratase/carnithine racemase
MPAQAAAELAIDLQNGVATVEIRRPPHNFFDVVLIEDLAQTFESLDADPACRAIVLGSAGKSFCAGANFGAGTEAGGSTANRLGGASDVGRLYTAAVRLFATQKPIIGAIHGAAVGGGLGLALVPDLRVTCAEARFSANFTRLGFHPGFGLTVTLPELIGPSKAALLFYTGRRVKGDEAVALGLADILVPEADVRTAAQALAREIADSAPLAVTATRATLRRGLADRVRAATERELVEQTRLRATADFAEGIRASAERRVPTFTGS